MAEKLRKKASRASAIVKVLLTELFRQPGLFKRSPQQSKEKPPDPHHGQKPFRREQAEREPEAVRGELGAARTGDAVDDGGEGARAVGGENSVG